MTVWATANTSQRILYNIQVADIHAQVAPKSAARHVPHQNYARRWRTLPPRRGDSSSIARRARLLFPMKPACHVCGAASEYLLAKDGYDLYKCSQCAPVFVYPQPTS